MRAAVVAVLLFATLVVAQPIRPQISETFEGEGYQHIKTSNETIWGLGRWVIDEPAGHALEFWEFQGEHRHHSVHILKRYDLSVEYAITFHHYPSPHVQCIKRAVRPPMPPAWQWVRDALYFGKHVIDGTTYDLWAHFFLGIELEVAVSEHSANRPHYFAQRTTHEHRTVHLISWNTYKPNATWFNVPDICKNATESIASVMPMADGDDSLVGTCGAAAAQAETVVNSANGFGAEQLLVNAFAKAQITLPSTRESMLLAGGACVGGARVGDVFFDESSAAVFLGGERFAECPNVMGGACRVVPFRDFTAGCRRFC